MFVDRRAKVGDTIASEALTEVAFICVESDGKSMYIAGRLDGPTAAGDGREANEDRRFLARVL